MGVGENTENRSPICHMTSQEVVPGDVRTFFGCLPEFKRHFERLGHRQGHRLGLWEGGTGERDE